jgi:signal transduction histidine kinase
VTVPSSHGNGVPTPLRVLLFMVGGGVAATAIGLLLVQLLMTPTASEVGEFALYFALTGAAVLIVSWLAIEGLERTRFASLRTKAALGALIASVASLVSVLVMAALMFISTGHDLPVLIAVLSFAAIVSASIAYLYAGRMSGRVAALTDSVEALARGETVRSAGVSGDPEIDRLDASIAELSSRLEEAAAQRARLDRERRELTAAISHDLRTPLASVRASVEALADDLVPADEVPRYYDRVERDVERLERLIEDLFELAQLDAGAIHLDRRPLPIAEIAADVLDAMRPLAGERGVALEFAVDEEPPPMLVDGNRIERVIGNLLRNALEHTTAGDTVRVSLGRDNGSAWVEVRDTGEGIPADDLERVWDRFVSGRSERGGTGLGLAIVRGIVQAHAGSVDVESSVGVGSVFTVRLPVGDPAS